MNYRNMTAEELLKEAFMSDDPLVKALGDKLEEAVYEIAYLNLEIDNV